MRAVGDDLDRRVRRRATAAVVAVVVPVVGGDRFLLYDWYRGPSDDPQRPMLDIPSTPPVTLHGLTVGATTVPEDFVTLVAIDSRWIAAIVALVVIPLWFWWWRRYAMSFARGIGVLASAATTAALVVLARPASEFSAAHVLVVAPVAYLAAFLVAPPPREHS
jgi:hypothetical protein